MDDFETDREKKIRLAFSKIKDEINTLKIEFSDLKSVINKQEDLLEAFLAEISKKKAETPSNNEFFESPETISIGNEGVQTNKQTNTQTNKQTHLKQTNTFSPLSAIKKDVITQFGILPKREFIIFLTIYQLEEDKGDVSYFDIATHLKLSESGVRHYVFNLLKKGLPLVKRKVNNKLTLISIIPEFKELNLKKDLVDLYLHSDPHQRTLRENF